MKFAVIMAGLIFATLSSPATARFERQVLTKPERQAVKSVVTAIKQRAELSEVFPGTTSEAHRASLRTVAKCTAKPPMKQAQGYFTVVWDCGAKGALGMEIRATGDKVTSIAAFEVVRR